MGEYIKFGGDVIKIGTCEDLTDFSYDALEIMVALGAAQQPGNEPPEDYLHGNWRYRFPWPDEPEGTGEQIGRYQAVTTPLVMAGSLVENWQHEDVGYWIRAHEQFAPGIQAPDMRLSQPCPQAKAPRWVHIVAQRHIDNQFWTVIECPYCHSKARLPQEEAAMLTAHMRATYDNNPWMLSVADVIDEGYKGE